MASEFGDGHDVDPGSHQAGNECVPEHMGRERHIGELAGETHRTVKRPNREPVAGRGDEQRRRARHRALLFPAFDELAGQGPEWHSPRRVTLSVSHDYVSLTGRESNVIDVEPAYLGDAQPRERHERYRGAVAGVAAALAGSENGSEFRLD